MGNVFVYSIAILSLLVQSAFDKNNTDAIMPASCPQVSKAGTLQNLITRIIQNCQDFAIARDSSKTAVFRLMIQKVFDQRINRRLLAGELHRWTKFVQGVKIPECYCGKLVKITAILKKNFCRTLSDEAIIRRMPKAVKVIFFFKTRLKMPLFYVNISIIRCVLPDSDESHTNINASLSGTYFVHFVNQKIFGKNWR